MSETPSFGRRPDTPDSWADLPVRKQAGGGAPPRGVDSYYKPDQGPKALDFPTTKAGWYFPWLTLLMLAAMAAIFWIEAGGPNGPLNLSPSVERMRALGGMSGVTVLDHGEWWRLLTAPLMHANLEHLLGNAFVFLICGAVLEGLIGRFWYGAVFVIGGIGGGIASITMNAPAVVGIGASGAIMALLAATFMCSFHTEAVFNAGRMRWISLRLAVPALIPYAAAGGAQVDFSAHFGGAVAGLAMGFLMQALWRENQPRPAGRPLAATIGIVGALGAIAAFGIVSLNYERWAKGDPRLAPSADLNGTTEEIAGRSALLVLRYPLDPRVRFYHALALAKENDPAGMEQDLRIALSQPELLRDNTPPEFTMTLRLLLAAVVAQEGRAAEAQDLAAPVCDYPFTDQGAKDMVRQMHAESICSYRIESDTSAQTLKSARDVYNAH